MRPHPDRGSIRPQPDAHVRGADPSQGAQPHQPGRQAVVTPSRPGRLLSPHQARRPTDYRRFVTSPCLSPMDKTAPCPPRRRYRRCRQRGWTGARASYGKQPHPAVEQRVDVARDRRSWATTEGMPLSDEKGLALFVVNQGVDFVIKTAVVGGLLRGQPRSPAHDRGDR